MKHSKDTIFACICIYILIAVNFSNIFNLIEDIQPGSFQLSESFEHEITQQDEFLYFSIVTLTTLGYGDIRPVSPVAKRYTNIEACFGILYLAIFVGRLISRKKELN